MIAVEGLTKTYGSRRAVDELSFTVAAGRVTGFVDPNGSGKSTTMRMMVGLTRPDAGRVTYDGVIGAGRLLGAASIETISGAHQRAVGVALDASVTDHRCRA